MVRGGKERGEDTRGDKRHGTEALKELREADENETRTVGYAAPNDVRVALPLLPSPHALSLYISCSVLAASQSFSLVPPASLDVTRSVCVKVGTGDTHVSLPVRMHVMMSLTNVLPCGSDFVDP